MPIPAQPRASPTPQRAPGVRGAQPGQLRAEARSRDESYGGKGEMPPRPFSSGAAAGGDVPPAPKGAEDRGRGMSLSSLWVRSALTLKRF